MGGLSIVHMVIFSAILALPVAAIITLVTLLIRKRRR